MELRLLVEASSLESEPSLTLDSKVWQLSSPYEVEGPPVPPSFCCISYLWGAESERTTHPFDPAALISSRTNQALEAAVRASECKAFWIDALCIPSSGPQRQATLESMGAIYSLAAEVIIVVADASFRLMRQLAQQDILSEAELETLEHDRWVSSIWTYQELANSRNAVFVGMDSTESGLVVEPADLLNGLGNALLKLQARLGLNNTAIPQRFPHLNALEEVLADWMTSSLETRSAFGAFSMMGHKRNADPASYFYAVLGALTTAPAELRWSVSELELQEKLMRTCELKGDYSFIFTVAPRSADPKRRWRPQPSALPADGKTLPAIVRPLFVWHCWGEAQRGYEDAAGLHLEEMAVMQPCSSMGAEGRAAIVRWLGEDHLAQAADAEIVETLHDRLAGLGYSGCAHPSCVPFGLVFPQHELRRDDIGSIFISTQIRWPLGAPGLILTSRNGPDLCVPCMFVGRSMALSGQTVTISAGS